MTGLFWYKILFMTEILVAETLFFFRLEKRSHYGCRLASSYVVCYLAAVLFPVGKRFAYNGWYTAIMFLSLFFLSVIALNFVYNLNWKKTFFCAIAAYTAQHLSYELFVLVFSMFEIPVSNALYGSTVMNFSQFSLRTVYIVLGYISIYCMVYGVVYLILVSRLDKGENLILKNGYILLLASLILLVDVVLNAFTVYVRDGYDKTYDIVTHVYNILCCVLVFYLQFSMMTIFEKQREVETVLRALHQSQLQYEGHRENAELINIKCHDLKHQIARFEANGIDRETVKNIEKLVAMYDTTVKTGNEVLDIVLTEKRLGCVAKDIKLTVMADGASLSFIKEGDLYALFGNILDNAIEAVAQLSDTDKRCVGLYVRAEGRFVSITAENYFSGCLQFSPEGMPLTTKEDKDFHGYGLKSIKMIVEKYGGTWSLETEEDIFRLHILFAGFHHNAN